MSIVKSSFTEVFSFRQLKEIKKAKNTTLDSTIYISKPSCPLQLYLFSGVLKKNSSRGIINCFDYGVMEALKQVLTDNPMSGLLLRTGFGSSDLLSENTIYIKLSPVYILRSVQINWFWERRMWNLSAQADKKAFTGVYYSVLGGAFCSLGKQNAQYAYKAGELAIKQIQLAKDLKDPILECKCWLYFAEDLIQLKRFRTSKIIISHQRRLVDSTQDPVLESMLGSVERKLNTALKGI